MSLPQIEQNEEAHRQDYVMQADIYSSPQQEFPAADTLAEVGSDKTLDQRLDLRAPAVTLTCSEPTLQFHLHPEYSLIFNPEEQKIPEYVTSKLCPSQQLDTTLLHCFEELELFYPCIDRRDFYNRLSDLFLLHSTCQGKSTRIPVLAEHLTLAALTCMLLAIGTYLGSGGPSDSNRLSPKDDYFRQASLLWYAESTMLLSKFDCSEHPNMDLLRFQMLEVVYMTMLDRKGGVSRSLALAVDLAYSLRLNNEQTWSSYTIREREYRRLLWWTLCYMDRRVALSFHRPLLLRHSNFDVGDFTELSFEQYMQDGVFDTDRNPSGLGIVRLSWHLPSMPPENYCDWLLFSMRWSKVVAQVWDTTLSFKATQTAANSIKTADALLIEIEKTLPLSLRWNAEDLPSSIMPGDMDRACRFKVIVFEVRTCDPQPTLIVVNTKKTMRPRTCYECRSGSLGCIVTEASYKAEAVAAATRTRLKWPRL